MFRATHLRDSSHPILVFGLDDEDLKRLQRGEPIALNCHAMGVECDVVIFTGHNTEAMAQTLAQALADQE